MKTIKIKTMFGFVVEIPFDGENYYCLVCGRVWRQDSPWDLDGGMTCEYCPVCGVQYGVSDMPSEKTGQTHADRIDEIRIAWLDRTGWMDSDVERVEKILGLDADQLRAMQSRVKKGDGRSGH